MSNVSVDSQPLDAKAENPVLPPVSSRGGVRHGDWSFVSALVISILLHALAIVFLWHWRMGFSQPVLVIGGDGASRDNASIFVSGTVVVGENQSLESMSDMLSAPSRQVQHPSLPLASIDEMIDEVADPLPGEFGLSFRHEPDSEASDILQVSGTWIGLGPQPISQPASDGASLRAKLPAGGLISPISLPEHQSTSHAIGEGVESSAPGDGGMPSPHSYNRPPRYPREARQRGWEGVAILQMEVLAEGTVGQITLVSSSGYQILDSAAIDAARDWKFNPAHHHGRPVASTVTVPIRFVLKEYRSGSSLSLTKRFRRESFPLRSCQGSPTTCFAGRLLPNRRKTRVSQRSH